MINTLFKILKEYGWSSPVDELTWCSTVPDGRLASISVGGQKIMRARRVDGFVALGVQLQFHGKQTLEIENRAQRLWKAFWAHKATIRNKDVSLFKRLQFLDAIAKTVFLALWFLDPYKSANANDSHSTAVNAKESPSV